MFQLLMKKLDVEVDIGTLVSILPKIEFKREPYRLITAYQNMMQEVIQQPELGVKLVLISEIHLH